MNSQITRRRQKGFSLIELMIVVAIIAIIAAIAVPAVQNNIAKGREVSAMQTLRTIHSAQIAFNSEKGKYGTLKELVEDEALQDTNYASGKAISAYVYSDSNITSSTYCVQATRESDGVAKRDFNITQKGVVYYVKSATKNPVPFGEGTPVSQQEVEKAKGK